MSCVKIVHSRSHDYNEIQTPSILLTATKLSTKLRNLTHKSHTHTHTRLFRNSDFIVPLWLTEILHWPADEMATVEPAGKQSISPSWLCSLSIPVKRPGSHHSPLELINIRLLYL